MKAYELADKQAIYVGGQLGRQTALELHRLAKVNADLLEALQELVEEAISVWGYPSDYPHIEKAYDAIKKATQ